jgi:hypothetical protein
MFLAAMSQLPDMTGVATFLAVGMLIWISWGFIAFSGLRRKKEIFGWSVSAIYHAAVLLMVIPIIDPPWRFHASAVIPIWWAIALVFSIVGIGLTLRNEEERA